MVENYVKDLGLCTQYIYPYIFYNCVVGEFPFIVLQVIMKWKKLCAISCGISSLFMQVVEQIHRVSHSDIVGTIQTCSLEVPREYLSFH